MSASTPDQGATQGLRNPPPDPHPRRPRHAIPDGAWDCHSHLFGPADRFRFDVASPYVSDDALPDQYLGLLDSLGLRYGVVVSAGGYGKDHRHLQWVLETAGDRLRGIMLPRDDVQADEIAALDRIGVRGVRMFGGPEGHEWNHLPRLDARIAALAADRGWHVQYHSLTRDEVADSADRLLATPGRIVLDHLGMFDPRLGLDQPAFQAVLRLLDSGRIWVKLSGPMRCAREEEFPYPGITPFARALVAHAPERLVWGSDWPHVQMNGRVMPNDGDLIDLLAEWAPDPATRFRILADNPIELYA
jgi:predicted TIM-barrel fold metal-dependent hydrolase